MVFNNSLLLGAGGQGGAATFDTTLIPNSVWLDGSADYLTRTPSGAGNRTRWTIAWWFQLNSISTEMVFFSANSGSNEFRIALESAGQMMVQDDNASMNRQTSMLFRDVGWYHCIVSYDSNQSIASDRVRVYVNGELQSLVSGSAAEPSSGGETFWNNNQANEIGRRSRTTSVYMKAYMAQICFLNADSIQNGDVSVSDFLDTFTLGTNGSQFIPKKNSEIAALATTAGGNSFCLDFADSSDLGNDISSNNNDFTPNSMASANQSTNTPSKTYSTFNPLAHADNSYPGTFTLSEGNQKNVINSSNTSVKTTVPFLMSGSNIIRAQFTFSTLGDGGCGITGSSHTAGTYHTAGNSIAGRGEVGLCGNGALVIDGNFNNSYTSALSNGDVVDVIVNCDVGAVYFAVDGTLLGGATQSEILAGTTTNAALVSSFVRRTAGEVFNFYAFQFNPTSTTIEYNSGQSSFTHSYSTITSLKSLNTADLPAPDYQGIDYFDATLYEGNGTGQRVGDFVPVTDVGTISQSVAFNLADSDKLTIASSVSTSPTNVQKKTVSCWLKPLEVKENWIIVGVNGSDSERIYSNSTGQIQYLAYSGGGTTAHVMTTGAFLADPSQWVHVVVALDYTDGSTEADRVKIYANGVRQTDLAATTYPANNMTSAAFINKASTEQIIGKHPSTSGGDATNFSNMYYAEYFMVDGHQLDASVFGQLDTSTNRWVPKASSTVTTAIGALSGGFGNCGFYLDFSNTSDYGEDDSGNNRDFTESGVLDATNQFADTPSSNFATIDPVISNGATPVTLSNGNLTGVRSSSGFQQAYSNFSGFRLQENTGIYFAEVLMGADSSNFSVGVLSGDPPSSTNRYLGQDSNTYGYAYDSGNKVNNGTGSSYGATYTSGDVIGIEIDTDTGSINFHKNGADQGQAFTAVPGPYSFAFDTESGGGPNTFNFGQQMVLGGASTTFNAAAGGRFKHTPPTGAKALNQDNLDDTASKLTAWAWIKNRDATDSHMLIDRVRGVGVEVHTDGTTTTPETTNTNTVQRFLQRGVQIGSDVQVNTANESYVLWQWLVGDSATTGSSIGAGSISTGVPSLASTALVADAGHFSVVTWTGNETAGATVGHGMGGEPEFIIAIARAESGENKPVYHTFMTSDNDHLKINESNAQGTAGTTIWDVSAMSSTLIGLGAAVQSNSNNGMVAYCFRSVSGVCKIGRYTGNGNGSTGAGYDGPYISLGFKPKFILLKRIDVANSWILQDTSRHLLNPVDNYLQAESNSAETGTSGDVDFLSNGIKIRNGNGNAWNANGGNYLYLAMADLGGNGTLPPIYGM